MTPPKILVLGADMPPSPALRYSPGREPRGINHKRGKSFESGLFSEKDDDLALFNEMQTRERENSLLLLTDDIEDTFCNLLYQSQFCNMEFEFGYVMQKDNFFFFCCSLLSIMLIFFSLCMLNFCLQQKN